jgi:hypothetical protein
MIDFLRTHPTWTLAALGCWIGFHFVLRPALLDLFREKLFELRDGLFDQAAAGKLSFDEPAYLMLRSEINASIYSAHMLTFGHLLWFAICRRWRPKAGDGTLHDLGRALDAQLAGLGEREAAKIIVKTRRDVAMLCAAALALTSLFFVLFMLLFAVCWIVSRVAKQLSDELSDLQEHLGERWMDAAVELRGPRGIDSRVGLRLAS